MQTMRQTHRGNSGRSLDVNDFDAIRISLASPSDIKAWSYGEVTKPETINYRTLKPEHGGLFCERIFGPTRDWECYCGKYKRIRHAGTVCDKCGVEVTRSKVRRERMGHIELAAPVTHIWYVKGTPSRLGLLLDVSPRNLERVLYFASYLITEVDLEARDEVVAQIYEALEEALAEVDSELEERLGELTGQRDSEVANLTQGSAGVASQIEKQLETDLAAIESEATALRERLAASENTSVDEDLTFRGEVVVKAGEAVNADRIATLSQLREKALEETRARAEHDVQSASALAGAESDKIQTESSDQIRRLEAQYESQKNDLRAEAEGLVKRINGIQLLQVITETEYRELMEDAPGVFRAGMGAEAVYDVVSKIDLDELATSLRQELQRMTGLRRKKATKRLRVVEALRKSGNRPEWMIFTSLPVIPPDLRPMVQLDGGRFATSDLNDLYRRVINRNNRLKRLLELGAPDIIVRNEKRMLQEAVDALIDNGRRGRVVSGSGKHKLKSLSDMLKGKQGRFRQNLLGKRVDYSGRSVIVVGPDLKLHECGLPKRMALELFKPFVMRRLVYHGHAHNIKAAKRLVEKVDDRVWEVLEEVIKDYVVLLNRAPTLHRLGIQAFEVKLIEGSAIQIHPLVCHAFNADFDGDQMAVHVPLSKAAQAEARARMLSTANLLDPSDGDPVISPTLEIVLGCYYMTVEREGVKGEGKVFASAAEVLMAYQTDLIDLHARIRVFDPKSGSQPLDPTSMTRRDPVGLVETTAGRVLFNHELPQELEFWNAAMDRKELRKLVAECYNRFGAEATAEIADRIKQIGFRFSTKGGLTIGLHDIAIPAAKTEIVGQADDEITKVERQYRRGLITSRERHAQVVKIWNEARDRLSSAVESNLGEDNSLYMMSFSGAKGNLNQITQMAGMRGLMLDPNGNIIDLPIRSNFREGLSVLEYFISTHGARKGLADTALRTADSGYLTRRLVDVAQDVIITLDDCETLSGMVVNAEAEDAEVFEARVLGRMMAAPIVTPDGEILLDRNQEITEEVIGAIRSSGVTEIKVRTSMDCEAVHGICALCYGRNLASGKLVGLGEAVGIIAAQSIGEPGTQLTMRTFHTGGVSHAEDITTGLPRVEELFEAREPKGKALLSEVEGVVEIVTEDEGRKIIIRNEDVVTEVFPVTEGYSVAVKDQEKISRGQPLAVSDNGKAPIVSTLDGIALLDDGNVVVQSEASEIKEYTIPHTAHVRVQDGGRVNPGDQLTDGNLDPQEVLMTRGREAVQRLLVDEVQRVYRSQGVVTNDKHIETVVRQMLRKVSIDDPGDTDLLPGELVDRFAFNQMNDEMVAQGGEPATAQEVLLGITKASLATDSFLSAASFQETTRVLTEAAINGKVDYLRGLKENVIIGKLIPAGSGFNVGRDGAAQLTAADEAAIASLVGGREVEPASIEDVEELVSGTGMATALADDMFDVDEQATDDVERLADNPDGSDAGEFALSNLFAQGEDDQADYHAADGDDDEV
jgi:DNA-directed RNA polymerase subunit beta'